MKKVLFLIILCLAVAVQAWADIAGNNTTTVSQNMWFPVYTCTNGNNVVPLSGTCVENNVNWTSLLNYTGQNVNWADITGVAGTGALYSGSTWIKTGSP